MQVTSEDLTALPTEWNLIKDAVLDAAATVHEYYVKSRKTPDPHVATSRLVRSRDATVLYQAVIDTVTWRLKAGVVHC
jgi:hypothetical protein